MLVFFLEFTSSNKVYILQVAAVDVLSSNALGLKIVIKILCKAFPYL